MGYWSDELVGNLARRFSPSVPFVRKAAAKGKLKAYNSSSFFVSQ
jgi:hypothetical protein